MPWYRVIISYVDPLAGNLAGTELIEKFDAVYRKSGVPPSVEVFHRSDDGNHVYYLSPKASEIAHDLLSNLLSEHFSSEPCADKPDLSGFCKILP
jgi:hypothetical protein